MSPLQSLRVLDLTWAVAGALFTNLLGWMGAEVIKVESRNHLDRQRSPENPVTGQPTNPMFGSDLFRSVNANKRGVTLELDDTDDYARVLQIASTSDIVAANMKGGTMTKLGLGYRALRSVRPDIVVVSSTGFGETGPWSKYRGEAPTLGAVSGVGNLSGYPDAPPATLLTSFDAANALFALEGTLAALHHRAVTGEGGFIDLSQTEGGACLIGDAFPSFFATGVEPMRRGNTDDVWAPHECYPCAGEDDWVSIVVCDQADWETFCKALGYPAWTRSASFADPAGRVAHKQELDAFVAEWTRTRTAWEITELFQNAGLAAMPVYTADEIFSDDQLAARGLVAWSAHPVGGTAPVMLPPWQIAGQAWRKVKPSPALGEDNDFLRYELLGESHS